jgi:predicted transcriptional regulator
LKLNNDSGTPVRFYSIKQRLKKLIEQVQDNSFKASRSRRKDKQKN